MAAPGSVFDLTNWKVTLPTNGAEEINQPALDTYEDANFTLNGANAIVMTAPVLGETTSGSGATRCEFREMEGGTEAAWSMATTGFRQLTVTGVFDPTGASPRKEMIVGQIHATGGTPPMYLAVEHHVATPRLRLFKAGSSSETVPGVSGLTSTTEITYRIRISGGRVKLWAAIGTVYDLPSTPQYDWAATDFTESTNCYLKAGSYNKSEVDAAGAGGESIATISHLELIQPADIVTQRLYLTNEAASYAPGAPNHFGDWQDTSGATSARLLGSAPGGSATSAEFTETSTTNQFRAMLRQFVSHPATAAGTLTGGWVMAAGWLESSSDANLYPYMTVWVTQGDSDVIRGPDYAVFAGGDTSGSVDEFPTGTAAGVLFGDPIFAYQTEIAFEVGDRIVVELGYYAENTIATAYTGRMHYGGTGSPDMAAGVTDMSRPGWIELNITEGVTFEAPVGPISESGTVADVVAEVYSNRINGSGDETYVVPSTGEAADLAASFGEIIAGDYQAAAVLVDPYGYDVVEFSDTTTGRDHVFLRERTPCTRFWGFYVWSLDAGRTDMVVEAPHPKADLHTHTEAASLFDKANARAFLLSTAHRNSNAATDGSGNRVSDLANYTGVNPLQSVHQTVAVAETTVVQIHGYGNSTDPNYDIIVSEGQPSPSLRTENLAQDLRDNVVVNAAAARVAVFDGVVGTALGATGNVQGQWSRSQGDHYWVHVEQNSDVRTDLTARGQVEDVLALGIPEVVTGTASVSLGALAAAATGEVISSTVDGVGYAGQGPDPAAYPAEDQYPSEDEYPSEGLPIGLGGLVATAAGTTSVLVDGTAAGALGSLVATGSGTRTTDGTATVPLGALAASASGTRTTDATGASDLGGLSSSVTGDRIATGSAVSALSGLAASASGRPQIVAAASAELGGVSGTASGIRSTGGMALADLGGLFAAGTGARVTTATAASPLGNLSATGAGEIAVPGVATAALGELTATATGDRTTHGTATASLGQLDASAATSPVGEAAAPLGNLSATASGDVVRAGAADAALGGLVASSTGDRIATAGASGAFGALAASGAGTRTVYAVVTAPLGELTGAGAGTRVTAGTATSVLGALIGVIQGEGVALVTGTATTALGALLADAEGLGFRPEVIPHAGQPTPGRGPHAGTPEVMDIPSAGTPTVVGIPGAGAPAVVGAASAGTPTVVELVSAGQPEELIA